MEFGDVKGAGKVWASAEKYYSQALQDFVEFVNWNYPTIVERGEALPLMG